MKIFDFCKNAIHSVKLLIKRKYNLYKFGIEVNNIYKSDHEKWRTCDLLLAIFQNNIGHVENLIRKNNCPDLDILRFSLFTPLHMAVVLQRHKIVDLLISAGAKLNTINNIGMTAMHLAILLEDEELVCSLVKAKADVNQQALNESGFDFWTQHVCIRPVHQILRKIVLKKLPQIGVKKYIHYTDDSPLHFAASLGCTNIVSQLICAMANIDIANKDGETPLHNAIAYGHIDTAKTLIEAGAKFDIADNNGQTALDLAKTKGDEVKKLFPNSLEPDASKSAEEQSSLAAATNSKIQAPTENRQKARLR